MAKEQDQIEFISYHEEGVFRTHVTRQFRTQEAGEILTEICTKPQDICVRNLGGRPRIYTTRKEKERAYRQRKKARKEVLIVTPLPPGPYRIIYADPPWDYGRKGYPKYGYAVCHYPVLSIDDLCTMPVKTLAAKHAVLFLWVTAPMLEKAFRVVKAWGFAYKTHVIWDKERHNFGHYVSVRHEILLLCTRGSCRPDVHELVDSVRVIQRGSHSEKPEEFRMLIDKLYPEGTRIELFARSVHDGWESWGNEVPTTEGGLDERV